MPAVSVQAIGGPTAIIEIGGLRVITDPTFDPPGYIPATWPTPIPGQRRV
jgi:hypothetical protein